MMQKETTNKLLAKCTSTNYGKLSILTQYNFKIKNLLTVENFNFYPKPNVQSLFIKLIPYDNKNKIINYKIFNLFLKKAFSNRRKKIAHLFNNLNIDTKDINLNKRPENIHLDEYIKLSNIINKHIRLEKKISNLINLN